jgi:hypothetical protein
MIEWTDERLQRLSIYRGGDEQLRSDIRAALDTISAQFRRAETAEATLSVTEQDRLDAHAAKEKAEAEAARLLEIKVYAEKAYEKLRADLTAKIERLEHELSDAKRSRDDAIGNAIRA